MHGLRASRTRHTRDNHDVGNTLLLLKLLHGFVIVHMYAPVPETVDAAMRLFVYGRIVLSIALRGGAFSVPSAKRGKDIVRDLG